MNRRKLFSAIAASALAFPAIANTQVPTRIDVVRERIKSATMFWKENMSATSVKPYFNGVLAGLGLKDWCVTSDHHPFDSGYIADIGVKFHEEPDTFYFIPVRSSPVVLSSNINAAG